MAKRKHNSRAFDVELAALNRSFPDEMRLPSLEQGRLEGFAHLFVIVLPQLSAAGEPVFSDSHLQALVRLLNNRFGGCMVPSSSSHAPFWGLWYPRDVEAAEPEKDYLTTMQVLTRPTDAPTRFFRQLKQVLKTGGNIDQEEILISRTDCWLI